MTNSNEAIRVDIVSDVVCPWCAIGYRQLAKASEETGISIDVHWHPFELNPTMPKEGQDVREHLAMKYGTSEEDSRKARERLRTIAGTLGFTINYADDMRIWNTFRAHQLIDWAADQGKAHETKIALLTAYFTDRRDVSDMTVLRDVAQQIGLDGEAAQTMLETEERATKVREEEEAWIARGVHAVPAMVFQEKNVATGARGEAAYASLLQRLRDDRDK